ncbi:MAG: hypothetical protein ACMXYB_00805 [Candidatus Woesearchaeota archaeon]
MNKITLILLLIILTTITTGCSAGGGFLGGSNSPVGPRGDDNIGDGLEVKLSSIDTRNLLQTQSIFFSLTLTNRNFEPIEIRPDNIRLRTIPADSNIEYSTIFSPDSVNSFYDSIFQGRGSIFISENFPFSGEFSLSIDDVHISNRAPFLAQDISVFIDINYEEEFEYDSNMLVNFDRNSIRNSLLQKKGPFTLSSFTVRTSNRGTILQYEIQAQVGSDSQIIFSNIQTRFGQYNLDCSYVRESGQFLDDYVITNTLTQRDSKLNVICEIPQSIVQRYNDDDTNFVFETSMKYEHSFTLQRNFRMPEFFD